MTIWDIAQAYQTLFNNGRYLKLHSLNAVVNPFTYKGEPIPFEMKEIYQSPNSKAIKEALKATLHPGGTAYSLNNILPNKSYMAKTGTTDAYRHGYTVLSDGDVMVVSWVSIGRVENGQLKFGQAPIPGYSGGASAGILAALILKELQLR